MKIKQTLALLFSFLLIAMSIPAGALVIDAPESAEEITEAVSETAVLAEDTAVAYAELPASYDETYGQLIFFENFDTDAAHANLAAVEVAHYNSAVVEINGRKAVLCNRCGSAAGCEYCFNGWSYEIVLVPVTDGATAFTYSDGTPVLGKVTVTADAYSDKGTAFTLYDVFSKSFTGASTAYSEGFRSGGIASIGASGSDWQTAVSTTVEVTEETTGFNRFAFSSTQSSANKAYYSSIRMYIKEPDNALWLKDSTGNRTFEIITGDTYTLPATIGETSVAGWTDGTSFIAPSTEIAKETAAGKTYTAITSVVQKPADYSDTHGQLIYFTNFKDSFENIANLSVYGISSASVVTDKAGNSYWAAKGKHFGTNDGLFPWATGIELISANGADKVISYADGTPIKGDVQMVTTIYSDSDGAFQIRDMYDVKLNNSWIQNAGNVGYCSDITKYWLGGSNRSFRSIEGAVADNPGTLKRLGYHPVNIGSGFSTYFASMALYVKNPKNALWLTDTSGENRKFTVVSGETYFFPAEFNGAAVSFWTDGTDVYAAGAEAALEAVANKTFKPYESKTVTLDVASIRTSAPSGLRYAGFVSALMRSSGLVEEYGFIVAGAEFFEKEDYSALKFNATGDKSGILDGTEINYASAAAYTKEGDDYSELKTAEEAKGIFPAAALESIDQSGYYYSVILTNIPSDRYSEKIVGKTYVKINGTYYYGTPVVRSIYEIAEQYGEGKSDFIDEILSTGSASGN